MIFGLRLCFHKYTAFKVGIYPLVAVYCPKCGNIKYGNCVYYDNSVFQKKYRGEEAIKFVKKYITELESRDQFMETHSRVTGINLWDKKERIYRGYYETIGRYKEIVNILKNAR